MSEDKTAAEIRQEKLFTLVSLATEGDGEAFEGLYRMKAREILFHTQSHLNHKAEVEDVAQEVVLRMALNIQKLKSPYAFNAWMYRIITFTCYEHNRKYSKSAKDESYEEAGDALTDIFETNRDANPEAAAEHKDQNEMVFRAIMGLPLKQKESIVMYYYDEMSYQEIADAMGVSINTVSTNILKGKKTLKKILDAGTEGSIIAGALKAGMGEMLPDEVLNRFAEQCHDQIAISRVQKGLANEGLRAARNAVGRVTAIAVIAVAVAIAVFVLIQSQGGSVPGGSDSPAASEFAAKEKTPYHPEVEVVGADGAVSYYINPSALRIRITDGIGTVVSSSVRDKAGNELFAGTDENAPGDIASLPSGEYEAVWLVSADDGRTAIVKWAFIVNY